MERVTVKRIFQISIKTLQPYPGLLLILLLEIVLNLFGWGVRNILASGGVAVEQLVQSILTAFLVEYQIYFAVYCYLTTQSFTCGNLCQIIGHRAVRLFGAALLRSVFSILLIPGLLEIGLIKNTFLGFLIQLLGFAVDFWMLYFNITILTSEPEERHLIKKTTRTIRFALGTRLRLWIISYLLITFLLAVPMVLLPTGWNEYFWAAIGAFFVCLVDMTVFVKLLPRECE